MGVMGKEGGRHGLVPVSVLEATAVVRRGMIVVSAGAMAVETVGNGWIQDISRRKKRENLLMGWNEDPEGERIENENRVLNLATVDGGAKQWRRDSLWWTSAHPLPRSCSWCFPLLAVSQR